MMEALSSSETPVLARATRRNIPEYTIFSLITYLYYWTMCGSVDTAMDFGMEGQVSVSGKVTLLSLPRSEHTGPLANPAIYLIGAMCSNPGEAVL
jgi:hypothetical protein